MIIVDVGMHEGKDALYYNARGYAVIAFEANPVLCEQMRQTIAGGSYDIDIRNAAVTEEKGDVTLFVNRFSTEWSSLDKDIGDRFGGSDAVTVRSCRLDEELSSVIGQIHYVKIDIEGYDHIALAQILRLETRPAYLSVENGSLAMLAAMRDAGYGAFKFSNQKYNRTLKVPSWSPHGRVIDHQFEAGSSGLWGEDLEGRWFSYEEAEQVVGAMNAAQQACKTVNLFGEAIGWFDLHARHGPL